MKNLFLSRINRTDQLYYIVRKLPKFLRHSLIKYYVSLMNRRIKNRGFPDRLTIFLTNRCNMRCSHCFVIKKEQTSTCEMGLEEYRAFFSGARGKFAQVLFTGGEPTLRQDFADILILAGNVGRCNSVSIFTNGLLQEHLVELVHRVLKETRIILNLQFSIDGLEQFHDANRGIKGALQKTLSTIDAISEIRNRFPKRFARVALATTITKRNINDLPAIIAKAEKMGVLHAFGFVRSSRAGVFNLKCKEELSEHNPVNFNDYLTVQDMENALKVISANLWSRRDYNLYYATNRTILETIKETVKTGRAKVDCMAGLAELTLMPNGDIARCEMLKTCANLKDFNWDLNALIASEVFKNNYKKTYGCWCTHECAIGTSITYDINLLNRVLGGDSGIGDQ